MSDETDVITLDVLATVSAAADHRAWLRRPFALDLAGERWTIATNGARLLAMRHDYGVAAPENDISASVSNFHAMAFCSDTAPVDVALLRDFFTANAPTSATVCLECHGEPSEDCEECDGEGEVDCECLDCGHQHTVECKACKGTGGPRCTRCGGVDTDLPVPVCIDGTVFDARIMAPLFAALPSGPAALHISTDKRSMWTLAGDDWFAVFMPMRADDTHGLPHLSLTAVPA